MLLALLGLAACTQPPIRTPPPLPVLPPVSPGDDTRPIPSSLDLLGCYSGLDGQPVRCIIWGEVSTGRWTMGGLNYAFPELCEFNPDRGDVYRSDSDGVVRYPLPQGCPS